MSIANPLWGAPRVHGELLKLGFEIAQSSSARYMIKRHGPGDEGWRTFLRNRAPEIAAIDLFVVPTVGFRLLYGFIIVRLDRRHLVWIDVTTTLAVDWITRQIIEAFPWDEAPKYFIRDRDCVFGAVVIRRLRAMGIGDRLNAAALPWQNCYSTTFKRACSLYVLNEIPPLIWPTKFSESNFPKAANNAGSEPPQPLFREQK